jgi:hypothetical protein
MKGIKLVLVIFGLVMMFGTSMLFSINNNFVDKQTKTSEMKEEGFELRTVNSTYQCQCRFQCSAWQQGSWSLFSGVGQYYSDQQSCSNDCQINCNDNANRFCQGTRAQIQFRCQRI